MAERDRWSVVFDLGGVFLDWDPRHLFGRLIGDPEDLERFLTEVCSPSWHHRQDLGEPIEEACAALARSHPEDAALIRAWAERNEEMIAGVISGTVAVLEELTEQGIRCFALSNMEREAYLVRRERFGFMERFEGMVISGLEGVAKPDPAIFLRLLERFGLEPDRTLFVDDRRENTAVAASLGFAVHDFTDATSLRADLVGRGLLAPLSGSA